MSMNDASTQSHAQAPPSTRHMSHSGLPLKVHLHAAQYKTILCDHTTSFKVLCFNHFLAGCMCFCTILDCVVAQCSRAWRKCLRKWVLRRHLQTSLLFS
jgi:hypothetical protein